MTNEERAESIRQFALDIRRGVYAKLLYYNHMHWTLKGKSVPPWLRGSHARTEEEREYMRNYMRRKRREEKAMVCRWECLDVLGETRCPYKSCRRTER